jgi:AraC-like DNA-binding protein
LAKNCGVSISTLVRHLQGTTGQSPHGWLRGLRLARAMELLADGSSVKETAAALGYQSRTNFSRDFRDYCGYPPSKHVLLGSRVCKK